MNLKNILARDDARHEGVRPINIFLLRLIYLGCCRFDGHLVKVEDRTGGGLWQRDGISAGSSRSRRSS